MKKDFFEVFNYFVEVSGKKKWRNAEVKVFMCLLKKWNDLGRPDWIGMGNEELHLKTGLSMLSITRAVKKLEERGDIKRIKGSLALRKPSEYRLFN